eukprot:365915-Chlamydomonas_euryale.AAC.6
MQVADSVPGVGMQAIRQRLSPSSARPDEIAVENSAVFRCALDAAPAGAAAPLHTRPRPLVSEKPYLLLPRATCTPARPLLR